MSMEKYGVDMETMPPTEEQLRRIKAAGLVIPQSFKQAQEMLSEMEKDGNENER